MIQAILFDMDGVVWESSGAHEASFKEALQEVGLGEIDFEYSKIAGKKSSEAWRLIYRANNLVIDEEALQKMTFLKQSLFLEKSSSIQINYDLLNTIQSQVTRRWSLVTSGSRKSMNIFLDSIGSNFKFEFCLSAEDVQSGKPSPEGFLSAAKLMGLQPHECIILEDSPSGLEAASRAGIRSVHIVSEHEDKCLLDSHPSTNLGCFAPAGKGLKEMVNTICRL